jgi:predicted alpha/beta superfamily hydrolase
MLARVIVMFALAVISMHSFAEPRHFELNSTEFVTLHSAQTGRDHELIIHFPSSYETSPDKVYPVLYFMDGYWDMPLLSSIYGNLMYDNLAPEFIMVGFSYPGKDVIYDTERRRELTPTHVDNEKNPTGFAPQFLEFIKQDVVPMMQKNYRADPKQRALGGVSLGGLFTLYAMYQEPEFFGRYISISPAVDWDKRFLLGVDERYAATHKALNARVFIGYGADEYTPFKAAILDYQKQFQQHNYSGLALKNRPMDELRHVTVKGEAYVYGLMWVFKDIAPTGPSGLEKSQTQKR